MNVPRAAEIALFRELQAPAGSSFRRKTMFLCARAYRASSSGVRSVDASLQTTISTILMLSRILFPDRRDWTRCVLALIPLWAMCRISVQGPPPPVQPDSSKYPFVSRRWASSPRSPLRFLSSFRAALVAAGGAPVLSCRLDTCSLFTTTS